VAVTTRTADNLISLAHRATAIGVFLYEQGDDCRQASDAVHAAAQLLAAAAEQISDRAARYAASAASI
jgi:histone H3/H4